MSAGKTGNKKARAESMRQAPPHMKDGFYACRRPLRANRITRAM